MKDFNFFEIKLSIFAGTTDRKAMNQAALKQLGFNTADLSEVKAVLNTTVLPKGVFNTPLAIKKSVQDFLLTKGHNHALLGRIFNPSDRIEILEFLNSKKNEYLQWRKEFLSSYEDLKKKQLEKVNEAAKTKGYEPDVFISAVEAAQPKKAYYERVLDFEFLDLSIKLDHDEWAGLINKINNDLVEKTIFELSRDSSKIRDMETSRGKVRAFKSLVEKLKSLSFYVKPVKELAERVLETVGIATRLLK